MLKPLAPILTDPRLRVIFAAIFLIGASFASVGPYQSLLAIEVFGLSDGAFALILVGMSLVNITASVTVGIITDQRANRRRMAIASAIGLAVSALAVWMSAKAVVFVIVHVVLFPVAGTLFGQIFAMARLAASTRPAAERDAILTAIRAFFALPFLVVLPLWALAFSNGVALISVYLATVFASSLVCLMLTLYWPRDGETPWKDEKSGLSFMAALRELASRSILSRVFLAGTIAGGTNLFMVVLGLLFHQIPGRGTSDVALFAGIVAGMEVPAMLVTSMLVLRYSKTGLIACGAIGYAGFMFVFPFIAAHPLVWLATIPAAASAGIILSVPLAYMQDLVSSRPGVGGTLLALSQVAAQMTGAAVFAIGTALSGYALVAMLGAGLVAGCGVMLWWIDRGKV